MRVLLLSVTNPIPADNGVKMRTRSILRALAAEGHEIILAAFADPSECGGPSPELARLCQRAILIPHTFKSLSASRDYFGQAKQLLSRFPYGVERSRSPQMAAQLAQILAQGAIDVIFSEQTDLLVNLPARFSVPLIVDFHNVEYLILERYLRFERNPAKLVYAWLECRKLRHWERRTCQMATVGLACSKHDQALLRQLRPDLPVSVVPNVVDFAEYEPVEEGIEPKILFQGGMDWYPNRDAAEFFARKIFPLVRKDVPNARFVVAGRNPPKEFRRSVSSVPGVELRGTVPDMRVEIACATVCVVPLRIGSGTRLKILEAAAMAKPVISTSVGAEGLEFLNGEEIIIEDDPSGFARALVKLLKAPADRKRLGEAARKRAEWQYGHPALCSSLRESMDQIGTLPQPQLLIGA